MSAERAEERRNDLATRGGGVVAVEKKEKRKRRRVADEAAQEERRMEVARLLLRRLNYREMLVELRKLPSERRPANVSLGTITRDVQVLRAEWAVGRSQRMEELVGEEVERLNELEKVWWPKALTGDKEATDTVLAIQRQRLHVMGIGGGRGAVQITAGAEVTKAGGPTTEGPLPAGSKVKLLVEYVDDRRDL